MNPQELRQLSLHYSFPYKFFELLQFGASRLLGDQPTFSILFARMKELNLFGISRFYLETFPENNFQKDEFANFLANNIEAADYIQIQYSDLLEDYRFPEELYDPANMAPYWKTTPRFIEPAAMHNIIQHALQLHVTDTSEIYRFTDPKLPEKYAASHIWEDLQHYICVDRNMKTIQIITSGFD